MTPPVPAPAGRRRIFVHYAHMLEVSRLLRELAKQGLCVVVITHDGEFLRESGAQTAEWLPKEQLQ